MRCFFLTKALFLNEIQSLFCVLVLFVKTLIEKFYNISFLSNMASRQDT